FIMSFTQEKLGKESSTLLLPQDMLRREILYTRDGFNTRTIPFLINLLTYGKQNCEYVILEGILTASWYHPVFIEAVKLFSNEIYAYYYDLSFEETLKRHSERSKSLEFGEMEMRKWWNEKDYLPNIKESILTEDDSLESVFHSICSDLGLLCKIK
ncbi:MAG: uridine kinase, partial [Eubacteriales bacterium]